MPSVFPDVYTDDDVHEIASGIWSRRTVRYDGMMGSGGAWEAGYLVPAPEESQEAYEEVIDEAPPSAAVRLTSDLFHTVADRISDIDTQEYWGQHFPAAEEFASEVVQRLMQEAAVEPRVREAVVARLDRDYIPAAERVFRSYPDDVYAAPGV